MINASFAERTSIYYKLCIEGNVRSRHGLASRQYFDRRRPRIQSEATRIAQLASIHIVLIIMVLHPVIYSNLKLAAKV